MKPMRIKKCWGGINFRSLCNARRVVKIIVVSAVVIAIAYLSGCLDFSSVLRPDQGKSESTKLFNYPPLSKATMMKPGEIHNEIVAAFEKRYPIEKHRSISAGDFVKYMAEATNEVLAEEHESARVSEKDIGRVLGLFFWFRDHQIYDFIGHTTSDPSNLADFFVDKGFMSREQADTLRSLFTRLYQPNASIDEISQNIDTSSYAKSSLWAMAIDVFKHSNSFWTQFSEDKLSTSSGKNTDNPELSLTRDSGVVFDDTLGFVTGSVLGSPLAGIFAGAIASIVFIEETADDCNDFDNYAWPEGLEG